MCSSGHGCCRADRSCEGSSILSGMLRPCLLLLIAEGKSKHGYELSSNLEDLGLDVSVEGGRLYRVLRHLERDGFVESAWDTQTSGPARREYFLTPTGREALVGALTDLNDAIRALKTLVNRIEQAVQRSQGPDTGKKPEV